MLDRERRELERALRESPRDRSLAERLLQALRRSGEIAPEPQGPLYVVEAVPNPGFAPGDLALIVRRSRPREAFEWRLEMEASIGEVATVVRIARDGLSAVVEGGRSYGFASLMRLSSA